MNTMENNYKVKLNLLLCKENEISETQEKNEKNKTEIFSLIEEIQMISKLLSFERELNRKKTKKILEYQEILKNIKRKKFYSENENQYEINSIEKSIENSEENDMEENKSFDKYTHLQKEYSQLKKCFLQEKQFNREIKQKLEKTVIKYNEKILEFAELEKDLKVVVKKYSNLCESFDFESKIINFHELLKEKMAIYSTEEEEYQYIE